MPRFRRLFFITLSLTTVVIVMLHVYPRNLRFFDPDHRHCGKSQVAHQWAIHAVYGARMSERGYYDRFTVSTSDELPRDKVQLHQILQTLAHVAQKTNRAIRINQSLIPGYVSEYLQPYSLINAPALHEYGVDVVEMGYWNRAVQAQKIKGQVVAKKVHLQQDPIGVLKQLQHNTDESVHELVFSVDELLSVPSDELLPLVGESLGYDFQNQQWKQLLACGHDEIIDKNPIPMRNDALSP
ncbi:hypothetical protein MHU86_25370 [Fragilaria crotonensis]|nr:hypothetical protein MHU86_25370 [Fragilaria crotonensis]